MHELSIATAVVDEVEKAAAAHGIDAVATVTLEVGRLAGVVASALELGFEVAAAGTVVEGARLEIDLRPLVVRCPEGGHDLELAQPDLWCSEHACATPQVISGRELRIVRFTAADEEMSHVASG